MTKASADPVSIRVEVAQISEIRFLFGLDDILICFPPCLVRTDPQPVREKLSPSPGGYSLGRRRQERPRYQFTARRNPTRAVSG